MKPNTKQFEQRPNGDSLGLLEEIQQRVLWLTTRIIDAANSDRPVADGMKVGGHQASSTSLVSIMTALWFAELRSNDYVSVKPHASPVFHAIQYLLGNLDLEYVTRLRSFGGLQSYPSRTKDPDGVDFSTGSVGLGAAAPLFAAVVRRYVDAHFGARPRSRFIALIGDAELDEGNVWEAVADPATSNLSDVLWIVDFNRQSLDRVIPGMRIDQWTGQFEAAGWNVVQLKYGSRLEAAFQRPGGEKLRQWIDGMPNEQYQSLFGRSPVKLRERFLQGAPKAVCSFVAGIDDASLGPLVTDLGGHDLEAILRVVTSADNVENRPTVVFAYTVKGWGLPIAGNPRNHSALLAGSQIDQLRADVGLTPDTEWDRFDESSAVGELCVLRRSALFRVPRSGHTELQVPQELGIGPRARQSTQDAFGRALVELSGGPVAPYIVTTAPDVATSTNLAGFINRKGIFAPKERRSWSEDPLLRWIERPDGQHIELGISEMNLFMLLCELGLSWDLSNQPLIPIGTVYDPFICRGLDALIYGAYSASSFIVAGTPSGITLASEGGAHQSTITPSIGIELPNATFMEPAYASAVDWMLCDAINNVWLTAQGRADPTVHYFRLSTRSIDQSPFEEARQRLGEVALRRAILQGAYVLKDPLESPDAVDRARPVVYLVASGAVMPEVLTAAEELAEEGVSAPVVDVTSASRLYAAWRGEVVGGIRSAVVPGLPGVLRRCFLKRAPIVTVHDAASHAMAWLGSALGVHSIALGVDSFGQSGSVGELYEAYDLGSGSVVSAALAVLALESGRGRYADWR